MTIYLGCLKRFIKNAIEDCLYEHHELHFLIYRNVGTVNYQCYDTYDNVLVVLTANLKSEESLITSMICLILL